MRDVILVILVSVASVVTLVCSIGMVVMRDPLQRLHFLSPPSAISGPLLAAAVFLDEPDVDVGLKAALVAVLLLLINGVATHATARAVRVRLHGVWEAVPEDHVRLVRDRRSGSSP